MKIEYIVARYQSAFEDIQKSLNNIIKQTVGTDIKIELFSTLQFIVNRDYCTNTEIARAFEVGKSTITAQINRLDEQGLIEKHRNAKDRRTIYLSATPKGLALFETIKQEIFTLLEDRLAFVEDIEISTFLASLEKLSNLLKNPQLPEK